VPLEFGCVLAAGRDKNRTSDFSGVPNGARRIDFAAI
jgi:hypothetical protein